MKFIHLKCDSCGAELELDPEHLQAYCQFCGSKLLIDMDQLSELLVEKEKTKRVVESEQNATKREEIKYHYKEEKDKRKHKQEMTELGFIFGVPILSTIVLVAPVLLIILPILAVVYFVYKKKK